MKKLVGIWLLFTPLMGFSQVKEFGWLVGTWKTTGKETYEVWKISKDKKTLQGISFRVKGADSVVTERVKIKREKDSFYYVPDVAGNQTEVNFKITKQSIDGFTAENFQHDFPKIIRYQRQANGSLKAEIEGNGKVIPYSFDRVK
ncbi:MAG TPA: DUF6265 family protein [Cyclobacteriaceae bacterium]|jgi:hypothetical protein|nr:DUF6265 family protein [Cyclobacteriaceae bacterium]